MKSETFEKLYSKDEVMNPTCVIHYINKKYSVKRCAVVINDNDEDILEFESNSEFLTWYVKSEFDGSKLEFDKTQDSMFAMLSTATMNIPVVTQARIKSGRVLMCHL
jgi:hypothetical protein